MKFLFLPSWSIQLILTLTVLFSIQPAAIGAETNGRRIALVIGNGQYQQSLPKLPNPTNDAEDVARELRGFGFEVIEVKNQTLEAMNRSVAEFGRKLIDSEAALFYYAGHGIQLKNQNYLIPVNAVLESDASVPYQSINLNQVLEEMENGKSRTNIVIIDACRNNPISGKFRSGQSRGLASPNFNPRGTVIVYATDPGNVAADGNGRNGLFTSGLLKAFRGSDLSLDGVLTTASAEVERASNQTQTPYVNGPKTLQKNFHFKVTVEPGPAEIEKIFWTSIERSTDPADYQAYLKKYPNGNYASLADNAIKKFKTKNEPVRLSAATGEYDGRWSMIFRCEPVMDRGISIRGYTKRFFVDVNNGRIAGEDGRPGEVGYWMISGAIQTDGTAEIIGNGLSGNQDATMGRLTPGKPFSLLMKGKFSSLSGEAVRTTDRPCNATFIKS